MLKSVFGPICFDRACVPPMMLDAHRGFRSWGDHQNARLLCACIPFDSALDDIGIAEIIISDKRNKHQQLTYTTDEETHVLAETFLSSGAWVMQFKSVLLGSRFINAVDVFGLYMHNHFDPLHNSGVLQ